MFGLSKNGSNEELLNPTASISSPPVEPAPEVSPEPEASIEEAPLADEPLPVDGEEEAPASEEPAPGAEQEVTPDTDEPQLPLEDMKAPDVSPKDDAVEQATQEDVITGDTATATLEHVDEETGEVEVTEMELAGNLNRTDTGEELPTYPSDSASLKYDGQRFLVRATQTRDNKVVVIGYTHNSDGGGLSQYADAHPELESPLVSEVSAAEQKALLAEV